MNWGNRGLVARGRPTGTDAWRRALACEHQHRAVKPDLPRDEALPLKQARWTAALEHALATAGIASKDLVPTTRAPRWKVEIATAVRKASGAPYRWIAEHVHLERPDSLRAAVCWLGRR